MSDNEEKVTKDKMIRGNVRQRLKASLLGNKVPKRGGKLAPPISRTILKLLGWKVVGNLPNVSKAVLIGLPHTSNFDGLYAIPAVLALDVDIKLMGKDSLFKYPILSDFFKWAGVIPIDRSKKGSVLKASIDKFNSRDSLFLGLAPEGTRGYTDKLKTGFYYIAKEANVPIIPVAMDYKTKEVRFMDPVYPTGDYDADIKQLLSQFKGIVPKYPDKMSKILKDLDSE